MGERYLSARLARRKEKVTYEDIPVVTQQTVPPKEEPQRLGDTVPTMGGVVIPNAPAPSRIITNDTVEHEGYLEPMKRVAAQYKAPPTVSIPIPPKVDLEDDRPVQPSRSTVTNVQDIPREPMDETLPGYPKIFSGKKKEPVST